MLTHLRADKTDIYFLRYVHSSSISIDNHSTIYDYFGNNGRTRLKTVTLMMHGVLCNARSLRPEQRVGLVTYPGCWDVAVCMALCAVLIALCCQ
jgi:hypothetical protein